MGLAQIIPVLLVATFVLKIRSGTAEEKRELARLSAKYRELKSQRTEPATAKEDFSDPGHTVLSQDNIAEQDPTARQDLPGLNTEFPVGRRGWMKARLQEQAQDLDRRKHALEEIEKRLAYQDAHENADESFARQDRLIFFYISSIISLGITAEILTLWAGLNLVPSKIGLGIGIASVTIITGFLGAYALADLLQQITRHTSSGGAGSLRFLTGFFGILDIAIIGATIWIIWAIIYEIKIIQG